LKRHEGPIYIYIYMSDFKRQERDILRELHCQMFSEQLLGKHLQIYWEFIQELQFVSSTLKERNLSVHLRKSVIIKRLAASCIVNFSEHKGKGFLKCLEVVKRIFYKVSENLKWVAWGLDVGTGSGRTSINRVCISLFPYLIYFIAINFILCI